MEQANLKKAEDGLKTKVERIRKLTSLAEAETGQSILGERRVSRAMWIAERNREEAQRQALETDVKSRRNDVARQSAMLAELDQHLASCVSRIRNVATEIDIAVNDV